MKVSIITVVYNGEKTIKDTIDSVIGQNYHDIEYIVIDGASTDGTMNIIQQYIDRIKKIVSEPDNGIYDAMNKGIKLATGDIVGILNADDYYCDDDVITNIVACFKTSQVDAVYGNLCYVDNIDTDKIIRQWNAGNYKINKFLYGWMPPHPAFFVKRDQYEKYGVFNTDFHFSADYELMLRFLYRYKISAAYFPQNIVKMRTGGVSNASIRNRIKANKEDVKAWEVNGLKSYFFTKFLKPLSKIKQFRNL